MANLRSLPQWTSAVGVVLSLALAAGCGSHRDDDEAPPGLEGEPIDNDEPDDEVPPPPAPPGDDCPTLGETRECTVYLPEVNGIVSCFVGLQVCETREDDEMGWSECDEQDEIDKRIAAMEAAGDL